MNQRFQPDGRSNRERMLSGDDYIADSELEREANHAANLLAAFNSAAAAFYL